MNNKSWEKKINRARYIERQILRLVKKKWDKDAYIPKEYTDEYDIVSEAMGNIEVKEDRIAHKTGNYAIEFKKSNGDITGLSVVTAKFYCIVDWTNVIFIATDTLKFLIKSVEDKKETRMGWKDTKGDQAIGWLIPKDKLICSEFSLLFKRWFPVLSEDEVRTN